MQKNFEFENTLELFFEKCALRVKEKIKEKGIPLKEIYPTNDKLISHIQNNQRYPNKNRYLLTDTVISYEENNSKKGLAPLLFDDDIHTLLWGTDEEIIQNSPTIFSCIIKDLLELPSPKNNDTNNKNIDDIDIHLILSDYAPYAFNWTYYNLLTKNNVACTDYSYGVLPYNIYRELPISYINAINFLYKKCEKIFNEKFIDFTKKTNSYSKLDSVFKKNFITNEFIPLLKKYIPQEDSIGLRIRHLILTDISNSSRLIKQHPNQDSFTKLDRKLIHLSTQYAHDLMELQKEYLPLFIEKYSC